MDLAPHHQTVVHMLQASVHRNPAGSALVFRDVRLTYAQLAASVTRFAGELSALGCAGSRVAVLLPNGADIVIAIYATFTAGAQAVLLNPDYSERELAEILDDAKPLAVVTGSQQFAQFEGLLKRIVGHHVLVVGGTTRTLVDTAAPPAPLALPKSETLAILQYTGGTTGRSKGVNLTHRSVATNVIQREALVPMRMDTERILCMTPLFHAYATAMALFPAALSGASLVVLERFKPELVFATVEREQITVFAGAPSIYNALVAHPDFRSRDMSSLRVCCSGSAPLSVEVLRRWEEVARAPIVEGYGLTEASPVLTFNPQGRPKPGSVGIAVPGTQIQIVDAADGQTVLEVGKLGEVRARGPQLMQGYRNRPEETAEMIRDGWIYTGDIGELDADGYLYIRDRKKDMVIVGGFNVYPREVDEVLYSHPAILEAAAIGVSDTYRGEVIHACVRLRPGESVTESGVIEHCAKNLVRYKVPVKVHFVDAIPRTPVGKVDRRALGAQLRSAAT